MRASARGSATALARGSLGTGSALWTTKMRKHKKSHDRLLQAFRKKDAAWDEEPEVFARLEEAKKSQIRKLGGLHKISHGALADLNRLHARPA